MVLEQALDQMALTLHRTRTSRGPIVHGLGMSQQSTSRESTSQHRTQVVPPWMEVATVLEQALDQLPATVLAQALALALHRRTSRGPIVYGPGKSRQSTSQESTSQHRTRAGRSSAIACRWRLL